MRLLVDECLGEEVAEHLRLGGHEVVWAHEAYSGAQDEFLAIELHKYDGFLSLDIHRQKSPWLAINRAVVESGVTVVRFRPPKAVPGGEPLARWIMDAQSKWSVHVVSSDVGIVTVSGNDVKVRITPRSEIPEIIRRRLGDPEVD